MDIAKVILVFGGLSLNSAIPQAAQTDSTPAVSSAGLLQNYGNSKPQWVKKLRSISGAKDNRKFRIVQIGDSHTAGDYFTDQLRQRLQSRWGNGGIGWIYPSAVKGQRQALPRYNSNGWATLTSRGSQADFPLGGVIAQSTTGGDLTINSTAQGSEGTQDVALFIKPAASHQTLSINGQHIPIENAGWQVLYTQATLPLSISNDAMPWTVGLVNIENQRAGVTLSAMGINGAQMSQWSKWRQNWLGDLAQTQADLVILAYGTNEAFNEKLDVQQTEQTWRGYIQQIKQALPNAGILVIGAPESLKTKAGDCGTRPAYLDAVQSMQMRVAQQEQTLYWSWQDAMGGACSMKAWSEQGLAAKDGVHFSKLGYQQAADVLANDLIALVK